MTILRCGLAAVAIITAITVAKGADVPDALSVEWQGKHPCEKLFEDAQVRVARCTFPPGAVHVCHSHPSYFSYTVSGGRGQVQDGKGTRSVDVVSGAYIDIPPVPWLEFTNIGDTTIQYIVVEKKYQPPPIADQASCPKATAARVR
jgi:quercetin dioxygenase-like cupin family protein